MRDSTPGPRTIHPQANGTCRHTPRCPGALAPDRIAARAVTGHAEQGWSLLCNGVVLFEDGGALLPDGRAVSSGSVYAVPAAA